MRTPYRLTLLITDACNFQCAGCLREFNKSTHLEFSAIAGLAAQAKELGFTHFALTGGEPFLHPHFRDIVDLLTKDFSINLVTNGYNAQKYAFLGEPQYTVKGRKPVITVSIDGASAEVHDRSRTPGSFDRAVESVRFFKSLGLRVMVQTILSKITAPTAHEMIPLIKELGLPQASFLNTLRTQHNHDIILSPEELATVRTRIMQHRIPEVKIRFATSAAVPRYGDAKDRAYLCERVRDFYRLDPVVTPAGKWEWCCDLVQDGGNTFGNVQDMPLAQVLEVMRVEAIKMHERRLLAVAEEQHPDFWTCEYCNKHYQAQVQMEGTAPRKFIIPLAVKK